MNTQSKKNPAQRWKYTEWRKIARTTREELMRSGTTTFSGLVRIFGRANAEELIRKGKVELGAGSYVKAKKTL